MQLENQERGREGGLVCLFVSSCLSVYSYSSLKPNDFSKGFMKAPVQVGTLSPGPPGSGGRRVDRVFPGVAPYLGGGVPHSLTWKQTSQPKGTNPSLQILAFPHTSTRVHTRVHSHTQTCTSKTRPPECACMSSCVHTYNSRHKAFSHTHQ